MTSKEALENIKTAPSFMGGNPRYWTYLNSTTPFLEDINIIKQDLDRLEKLEKENKELKNTILSLELDTCIPELRKESAKLKKVIEILEKRLGVKLKVCINGGCSISILVNDRLITPNNEYLKYIDKEEYELLNEVLGNAKDN